MRLPKNGQFVLLAFLVSLVGCDEELWEKDMSEELYIEGSHDGFETVKVHCTGDTIEVEVVMTEPFHGVFYTRGNYKEAKAPCYLDATGETALQLNLPLKGCKNKRKKGETKISNTVIVQHDDYFIFPGDTAFDVACDGTTPSIGLADPDPSAKELPKHKKSTVTGNEAIVVFTPDDIRPRKKKKNQEHEEL